MSKHFYLFALSALSLFGCASPCESESNLKELARQSVLSNLKTPSTANFSEEKVSPAKDGQGIVVEGLVDAQNSFGAMMREEYSVNFKCGQGSPYVAYAWMDDKEWGTEHEAMVDSLLDALEESVLSSPVHIP